MEIVQPALGLAVLVAVAWGLSEDRRARPWRMIAVGLVLQIALAALALKVPPVREAVQSITGLVRALETATRAGTSFVFGFLGGGTLPYEETRPGASFTLAFRALPLVLVTSTVSAVLWHWGVLPRIIGALAAGLRRSLGIDGPVALAAAANVFAGMIEAALLIRPRLAAMSRSDLFVTMVCGMTTIGGTVLALYASILDGVIPGAAGHLVVASLISAPAAVVIARLMIPPGDAPPVTPSPAEEAVAAAPLYGSTMDALMQGTRDGLQLLLNIVATLLVFVALVSLVDQILGLLPDLAGAPLALERLLGWVLSPLAWLLGIPAAEAETAGRLLGTKIVLNELIAYINMSGLPPEALSERSRTILLYALCSFANFGSVGILLAGYMVMVPERRTELLGLGMRSLVAGTLATAMTGAVVALLV